MTVGDLPTPMMTGEKVEGISRKFELEVKCQEGQNPGAMSIFSGFPRNPFDSFSVVIVTG